MKIAFNKIPHKPSPFPLPSFDVEIGINDFKLVPTFHDDITFRSCILEIEHDGKRYPCGEVKLYHSGGVFNYEQTYLSAKNLAEEICKRFNSFQEKGQACFELS